MTYARIISRVLLALGGGALLFVLMVPLIAILAPVVSVYAWAVGTKKRIPPSVNALAWTGMIWGASTVIGPFVPKVVDTSTAIMAAGTVLTLVVVVRGGYQPGWLGWILLFTLGPVGTAVLLWRGVAPRADAPAARSATSVALVSGRTAGTITVEMTPEVRTALAGRRRLWRGLILGGVVIAVGSYLLFTTPKVEEGVGILAIGAFPIGVLLAVAVALAGELPIDRDLASGSHLRTSGPVRMEAHSFRQSNNRLWVGDRNCSSWVIGSSPNNLLDWTTVDWATVDHTLKSDIMLSVRDGTGQVRYAMRGYQP